MSRAVRLVGVTKSFAHRGEDHVWAARELSLEIARGEAVGVIGPNGAGKTTLLRMIAGIVQPDDGWIERLPRTVALIDLAAGFHPDLTGEENIDFAGALLGMRQRDVDASRESIRDFAGLGAGIDKQVRHFSSGMLARLSFAIAVHSRPDLLLVDEVLAVGDIAFQSACFAKLEELHRAGVTSILVSHDLGAIAALCDRAILLDGGRRRSDGPPSVVISEYLGTTLDTSTAAVDAKLAVRSVEEHPLRLGVEVVFRAERRHPDAVGVIEIGLPVHPAANVVEGLDGPLIFASAPVVGPWDEMGDHRLDYMIRAAGLPPGRFIMRLVLSAPAEEVVVTSSEFSVPGPPPVSPQVVLEASVAVRELPGGDRS